MSLDSESRAGTNAVGTWDIPVAWAWSQMGQISAVVGGGTPDTKNPANFGREVAWVTPADLSGYTAKFVSDGSRYLSKQGLNNSGAQLMPAGSVLFSSRAPIGYVAIAANPICTNQGFKSFVLEQGLSPDYVYYFLRHAKPIATKLASGTTFLEISGKNAARIPIPIAPTNEQSRISDALDELLSDLDAGVSALEQVRAKLKLYRASVLKAAVDGTLTAEWRAKHPGVEPASELLKRILTERRRLWEEDQLAKFKAKGQEPPKNWKAKYKARIAPNSSKTPSLPPGWCWVTVDQIGDVGTGATPNRAMKARYYDGGSIPWITSSSANSPFVSEALEFVSPKALEECNLTLYPPGTLLIAMYGEGKTRGKCSELQISTTTNQALAAIQSHAEVKKYLKVFFVKNYQDVRRSASGGVQPNMNLSMVREIMFPLPPLAEQEAIVEAAEDQISIIDHLESDLDAKVNASQGLRQAVLHHAFSGKLVPQDPNDEPASELLKRIAAEREERAKVAEKVKRPAKRRPARA